MSILSKIFGQVKELRSPFVASIASGYGSFLGYKRNEAEYIKQYRGWVYACVVARAEAVGAIQLILSKNGEVVEEHDALDVLYKVNPYMTKREMLIATQAYLDLTGNAFWYLAREGKEGEGAIREIYIMRPDRVNVIPSKENPLIVAGYIFKGKDGKDVPFDVKEVLHFRNFNPMGDYPFPCRGMGIVEAACYAIDTDNQAQEWNFSFFKNSARPDGLLEGEVALDADELERVKAEWASVYKGSDKAHKVAFLGGGLKWRELGRSQKESDFLEQRRFSRDEILALFRCPKTVLGMVDDVNRANAEATNFVFADRTVRPLMDNIVDTLNEFYLGNFDDTLELSYVSPVPVDRAQVINEYTLGINKWLTRNEIRQREGLTPTEQGNIMYGSLADVPQDTASEEIKSAKPVSKSVDKVVEKFLAKLPPAKKGFKELPEEAVKAHIEIWKAMFTSNGKPLENQMKQHWDKQEKEVLANLNRELKGLETKEFSLKAVDDFLFDEDDAVKASIEIIVPNMRKFIKDGAKQGLVIVGASDVVFNPNTPALLKFIKQRSTLFAEGTTKTKRDQLFNTLKEGVAHDEALSELTKRVQEVYGEEKLKFEATRIARTEITASANVGAQQAFVQAGFTYQRWLVVDPEDADCLMNEGEVVKIGSAFPSGAYYPSDDDGSHPNCMCTVIAVAEDEL